MNVYVPKNGKSGTFNQTYVPENGKSGTYMELIKRVDYRCEMWKLVDFGNSMIREYQEGKPLRELQIYSECSQSLNELLANLNQLKKR